MEQAQLDAERFDFQGDYTRSDDGRELAAIRLEEEQARHERLKGCGNAITVRSGDASVTMKKDGTIIKGKDLQTDKSGKINMKATRNVVVKGSKSLNN